MLSHRSFSKVVGLSVLCLVVSCSDSKTFQQTNTPDRETSLYEDSGFREINQLEGSIGIIEVRGQRAYFDQKRQKLLKPVGYFQDLLPFKEGLAAASRQGQLGFINEQGEWAIPPRFPADNVEVDYQQTNRFHNGIALVRAGGKDQFINKQGELIGPAFEFARPFVKDVAVVMVNNKYGFINKQGKFVVTPQFTEEPQGDFTKGGMLVKVNGQDRCIDSQGVQIKIVHGMSAEQNHCQYLETRETEETVFKIKNGYVYRQGQRFLNHKWDIVIKSQESDKRTYKGLYIYVVNKKWGLVHKSGEVITPAQFDVTEPVGEGGLSARMNNIDDFFFGYSYFYNGLAQAKINGKYGFIDETGKFVIPPTFNEAQHFKFSANITAAKRGNKWGAINRQGNWVIQPKFEASFQFDRRFGSLALFQAKNKYGFIDRQGTIVMPAQIDEIYNHRFGESVGVGNFYDSLPNEGLIKARMGKKWGYINTQGKIQIPMKFDEAIDFRYGVAEVQLGSKTLYIDRQGKVLPF